MSSKDLHIETQKLTIADLQRQLSEFEEAFATKTAQCCDLKKRVAELERMLAAVDDLAGDGAMNLATDRFWNRRQ